MLRSRSTFAVIFSIVLVFGAVWVRYTTAKEASANAENQILLDNAADQYGDFNTKEAFLKSLGEKPEPAQLSSTDLIGRQLFSDYMKLVSNGQATPENLNKLADSYAKNVVSTRSSAKITANDLNVVPDSQIAYQAYGLKISDIRTRYEKLVNTEIESLGGAGKVAQNIDVFSLHAAELYRKSAEELKALSVPNSLAENHLLLVNNYFESSNNLSAVGNVKSDPASGFAALNSQASTSQKENEYLINIQTFLQSKGITIHIST